MCVNNMRSYFQQCPWEIGVGQGEEGWYTQRVKTAWLWLGLAAKIPGWAISFILSANGPRKQSSYLVGTPCSVQGSVESWLCVKAGRQPQQGRAHLVSIAWAAWSLMYLGQLRQSCVQFGARGLYAGYGYKLPPKRIAGVLCLPSPDYEFMAWYIQKQNIWSTVSTASAYAHITTILWCFEILHNTLKIYVYMVVQHCLYLSALQYWDKTTF